MLSGAAPGSSRSAALFCRTVANAAGCTIIYGAMFDEVERGHGDVQTRAHARTLPAQGTFVPLNIDGLNLPSDWYLRLANEAGKMLRGEIPLQTALPTAP